MTPLLSFQAAAQSFPEALGEYGWWGVLIWLIAERVIPFFKDSLMPARVEARKVKAQQDMDERGRLARLEERQVEAFERIGEAVAEISKTNAAMNARLCFVERTQGDLLAGVNQLIGRRQAKGKTNENIGS
ncbi:MAG: hypothetical protein EHM48_00885 [Planctomycetaceae bacterium]|nr:MAG: hypothetical protein EHM48_00885 [Planctomycetaceae bacterium]